MVKKKNTQKGLSPLFSGMVILILSLSFLYIIMQFLVPYFQTIQDTKIQNNSIDSLKQINKTISEIKEHDINSYKIINLDSLKEIVVDSNQNKIIVEQFINNKQLYESYREDFIGNVSVTKENQYFIYSLDFENIDVNYDVVIPYGRQRVIFMVIDEGENPVITIRPYQDLVDSIRYVDLEENVITLKNSHLLETIDIRGYKIITDLSFSPLEEKKIIDAVSIAPNQTKDINILCSPDEDFVVRFYTLDDYFDVEITTSDYDPLYCYSEDLLGWWRFDGGVYDDFNDNELDSSTWQTFGTQHGSITVENSEVTIVNQSGSSAYSIGFASQVKFPVGTIIKTKVKNTIGRHSAIVGIGEDPFCPYPHGSGSNKGATLYSRADAATATISLRRENETTSSNTPTVTDYRDYHIVELHRTTQNLIEYFVDGTKVGEFTDAGLSNDYYVYFSADGWYPNNTIVVDWISIENPSDTTKDYSGNENSATVYGATIKDGVLGQAYEFDGNTNYIDCGNDSIFNLENTGTIATWLKIPSIWTGQMYPNIISKGASAGWDTEGWSLYAFSSNSIGIGMRNNASTPKTFSRSFTNIIKDKWMHVVGVWDGISVKVYQNGIQKTTTPQTIIPATNNYYLLIGKSHSCDHHFGGVIDEVRVYNKALTSEEIQEIYDLEKPE